MTTTGKTGCRPRSVKPKTTHTPLRSLKLADNQSRKKLQIYIGLGYSPFGFLGVHKFYLGKTAEGLAFLLPSLLLAPFSLLLSFFFMSSVCWLLLKIETTKAYKEKSFIRDADGRTLHL